MVRVSHLLGFATASKAIDIALAENHPQYASSHDMQSPLAAPGPADYQCQVEKPVAFFLAGDSTTAVQSVDGGGWGNGFLSFLKGPSWGANFGGNGATTESFVANGNWADVKRNVMESMEHYDCYVTIQFGHNDQLPMRNISLDQYQANLAGLAAEITELGATPILVTPLTRRDFISEHRVDDSLHNERLRTIAAAEEASTTWIDLNAASISFVEAIGEERAHQYNLIPTDTTHLNEYGSIVFGRIVADLILRERALRACLVEWIIPHRTLSKEIWDA